MFVLVWLSVPGLGPREECFTAAADAPSTAISNFLGARAAARVSQAQVMSGALPLDAAQRAIELRVRAAEQRARDAERRFDFASRTAQDVKNFAANASMKSKFVKEAGILQIYLRLGLMDDRSSRRMSKRSCRQSSPPSVPTAPPPLHLRALACRCAFCFP